MLKDVKLRELLELWKANKGITQTELVIKFKTNTQNINRRMEAIGLGKSKGPDKETRYVPLYGIELKEIKEVLPEFLSERECIQHYIELGYNFYSIALHMNVLLAAIENAHNDLIVRKKHPASAPASAKRSEDGNRSEDGKPGDVPIPDQLVPERLVPERLVPERLVPERLVPDQLVKEQQLTVQPDLKEYPETPQEQDNRVYEYGQQEDNYPEFGDEQPYHISEITKAQFFYNGIPLCQRCKRDVTYTDVIHYNNTRPAYSDSFINVNARPKIIFPMQVACDHMNQWAEYVNFPLTGYKDIDDIRILEAFVADTIANFVRNRMAYIAKELLQNRKKPGYYWGGRSYK